MTILPLELLTHINENSFILCNPILDLFKGVCCMFGGEILIGFAVLSVAFLGQRTLCVEISEAGKCSSQNGHRAPSPLAIGSSCAAKFSFPHPTNATNAKINRTCFMPATLCLTGTGVNTVGSGVTWREKYCSAPQDGRGHAGDLLFLLVRKQ